MSYLNQRDLQDVNTVLGFRKKPSLRINKARTEQNINSLFAMCPVSNSKNVGLSMFIKIPL